MADGTSPLAEVSSGVQRDPRRERPILVTWNGDIGRLSIDDVLWAAVEWSEKRQGWCIEDAEGRCLSHKEHIHGKAASKEAALAEAEAMIHDGRMPSPAAARKRRKARLAEQRERRAKQPAERRRREERERSYALMAAAWKAKERDNKAVPLHEVLAEAFDLTDPDLWRSNAFASLRPRLALHVERVVAELEDAKPSSDEGKRRLKRGQEILRLLHANGEEAATSDVA